MKLSSLTQLIFAGALVAQADMLELKDGKLLTGTYMGGTTGTIRFEASGNMEVFPVTSVIALTISRSASQTSGSQNPPSPSKVIVAPQARATAPSGPQVVPAGTGFNIRLRSTISTASARAGQKFDAILETDLRAGSVLVAPRGSIVKGTVTDAKAPKRLRKAAALAITLDEVIVENRSIRLTTTTHQTVTGPDGSIVKGAILGAVVGEIASNKAGRGAKYGAAAGALKKGDDIVFASGSLITFRLASAITVSP